MMNVMTVEQELCIRMLSQSVDKIDRNVGPAQHDTIEVSAIHVPTT